MRFYNTKKPEDVIKIFPWLIPTETETRMDIAKEIAFRLEKYPEDTFVLIAIENYITRAILVVHKLSKKVVWCWQANSESGFKYSKYMFTAMISWAKSRGAKNIGTNPSKRKEALMRRWGFKKIRNGELRLKI